MTNEIEDIHVYRLDQPELRRVSRNSRGDQADRTSNNPVLNDNGGLIAFDSDATNLVFDRNTGALTDSNNVKDVFQVTNPTLGFVIDECAKGFFGNVNMRGQGFALEVDVGQNLLAAGWYTASPSTGQLEWYTLLGSINGNSAEMSILRTTGVRFGEAAAVASPAIGSGRMTFTDGDHASFSYTLTAFNRSGSIELTRSLGTPSACGGPAFPSSAAVQIDERSRGFFNNPNMSGQGLVFEVDAHLNLFAAGWYTASPSTGQLEWYTLTGPITRNTANLTVFRSEGVRFTENAAVSNRAIGTARISFTSCSSAQLEYTFSELGPTGSIALGRILSAPASCQ